MSYFSRLRYVNASEKMFYACSTLIICISGHSSAAALLIFWTNFSLTVGKGKIPLRYYMRYMLIPVLFLIPGSAAVILDISGIPADAFAFRVGKWYVTGSTASLEKGIELCITALSAVSSLYFLSMNTTMPDIIKVMKKLKVPSLIIELMILIYRFIFVLFKTASSIIVSQKSRMGYFSIRTGIRSFGSMGNAVFLQAFRRADHIFDAMDSRCYDGTIHVLSKESRINKKEILGIILFDILLLVIAAGSRII